MPDRRYFRGPRRSSAGRAEGPPDDSSPPPMARSEGEGGPGAAGARAPGRRRRRGRGGRGPRPEGAPQGPYESGAPPAERREGGGFFGSDEGKSLAPDFARPGGDEAPPGDDRGDRGPDGARRKRRRRGRGRRAEGQPALAGDVELGEGELPSDYIALPVEHGMPVLYQPRHPERVDEEPDREPARPVKAKRVNSGKLFWYIRSKSYVPIPELRRRFEITPDEMGTIQDDGHKLYVGLPQDIADVVANLRRQQKIGLECSVDFTMPVVIGVYPLSR